MHPAGEDGDVELKRLAHPVEPLDLGLDLGVYALGRINQLGRELRPGVGLLGLQLGPCGGSGSVGFGIQASPSSPCLG